MPAIGPIDYVYFWTSDMDRAVRFYGRVLGLRLVHQDQSKWAEFDAGPLRFALHAAVEDRAPEPGGTVVFRVDDLDAVRAEIEARGAEFEEPAGEIEGYARFASLRDPDGNRVDLIEYRKAGR
jgi:predicted enzyme related to lactoylglutathione lyase